MAYCYYDEYGRFRSTRGVSLGWKQWTSLDPYKQIEKDKGSLKKSISKNTRVNSRQFSTQEYRTGSKIFLTKCSCSSCKGIEIFFCDCSNGGKVFFETLYPEWRKHNCPCFQEKNQSSNSQVHDYYSLVFPSSFKDNKLFYKKINDLPAFTIEVKNKYIYNNAIKNINLLVKYKKSRIILKVILSSKKFSNYLLVNNAIFNSFQEFKKFLIYILTQMDLSKDKDFKIFYNSENTNIDEKPDIILDRKANIYLDAKADIYLSSKELKKTKLKGVFRVSCNLK